MCLSSAQSWSAAVQLEMVAAAAEQGQPERSRAAESACRGSWEISPLPSGPGASRRPYRSAPDVVARRHVRGSGTRFVLNFERSL